MNVVNHYRDHPILVVFPRTRPGIYTFIIYPIDIDEELNNMVSKSSDDIQISHAILGEEDKLRLHEDRDDIIEWSRKWQMPFDIIKCQLLQVGIFNKKLDYEVIGRKIKDNLSVMDQGVIVSNNFKFSQHCDEAAMKTNRILGITNGNFTYKRKDVILPLY
ncbi:uncharacterized protein [Panulirus ornatus]|uniref:uncharacterized protein n=1 Tax=Panulirus ornatus TaxID=150431 RepID=UPI003A851440